MTAKDLRRRLKALGCRETRQRGSHRRIERDLESCLGKGFDMSRIPWAPRVSLQRASSAFHRMTSSLPARRAVRVLRSGRLKMSARDAARLLGLSHQRVHQLTRVARESSSQSTQCSSRFHVDARVTSACRPHAAVITGIPQYRLRAIEDAR